MPFPNQRLRRLRRKEVLRKMVRETHLRVDDLIFPIFVRSGKSQKVEISSMPGIFQYSIDTLCKELEEVQSLDIPAVLLFGLPDEKNELGSEAYAPQGIVQQAGGGSDGYLTGIGIGNDDRPGGEGRAAQGNEP